MKKTVFSALIISLALVIPATSWVTVSAQGAGAGSAYDFSRDGDKGYITVTASDLVDAFAGGISEEEKRFLSVEGNFILRYSDPNVSSLSADFDGKNYTVTAKADSYTAKNGVKITWEPQTADGNNFQKNGEEYVAFGVAGDKDTAEVVYGADIPIDDSVLKGLLNKAFEAGEDAYNKIEDREAGERKYEEYLSALERYRKEKENYEKYLLSLAQWQKKKQTYAKYLNDLADYEDKLKVYNEYLAARDEYLEDVNEYADYQAAEKRYEKQLEEYEAATDSPEAQAALFHLSILDYMTDPVTDMNRTLIDAILGNSVTQVLAERDALIKGGRVEAAVIDLAREATMNLRVVLGEYKKVKTEEGKYFFYIAYYETLRDNFCDLLRALDYLYQNPSTPMPARYIYENGKQRQFNILLAQLYYICNALCDGEVEAYKGESITYSREKFDENYEILNGRSISDKNHKFLSPSEVLGGAELVDCENAAPLENGYPGLPEKPVRPEPVKKPEAPEEVRQPVPPERVEDPGEAPGEVKNPEAPDPVPNPDESADTPPTEWEKFLCEAYKEKKLGDGQRTVTGEDYRYHAEFTVEKYFRNTKYVTVAFHAEAGGEVKYLTEQEAGLSVDYPFETPTKKKQGYTYEFAGWGTENGTAVNIKAIPSDLGERLDLYPIFVETPINYMVVWRIGNNSFTEYFPYGESPVYDIEKYGVPEKKGSDERLYRFTGWESGGEFFPDGERLKPMEDKTARYEAVFEESFVITWSVNGKAERVAVWKGDTPKYDGEPKKAPDIGQGKSFAYPFIGFDKVIVPAEKDETYTALFGKRPLFGGASVVKKGDNYEIDCSSAGELKNFNVSEFLRLAAENDCGAIIMARGAAITFSADGLREIFESGAELMTIDVLGTGRYAYRAGVSFTGENVAPAVETRYNFKITGAFDERNSYVCALRPDGSYADVRLNSLSEKEVEFDATTNVSYIIERQFVITVCDFEYAEVKTDKPRAAAGEVVTVNVGKFAEGRSLDSIIVVDAAGNDVKVSGNKFVMPECAVSVAVKGKAAEFTVTFYSDGKVIAVRTYRYGEIPEFPADPVKKADDKNIYVFIGWDREFEPVTANAIYQAQFRAEPIADDPLPPSKTIKVIREVIASAAIFAVLMVALIGYIVKAFPRRGKKRKGR